MAEREVILLCGPPGSGKTTAARASRLTLFDRDDPRWPDERSFTRAIARLRGDRSARAVVIRAAPTSKARDRWARLIGATHVYVVDIDAPTCARRVRARARNDLRQSLGAIPAWFEKHDRDDGAQSFNGWKAHRMSADRSRYGAAHERERRKWAPKVRRGGVTCWRCGEAISPSEPWDLGHADGSDSIYNGPEHRRCNRGAAAKLTNQRRRNKGLPTSEPW